jgi:hypothetical protein
MAAARRSCKNLAVAAKALTAVGGVRTRAPFGKLKKRALAASAASDFYKSRSLTIRSGDTN